MACDTLPFPAIVGQETLKRALLAVGVNDDLDGLLVRGEKGTAKSTAVRALADLLADQRVIAGCPYGCPPDDPARQCETCRERDEYEIEQRPVPLVTLPLGATRDRVVGTLSVGDALAGEATFDPGLLARANRGILYVDEVNLLDDHLVDLLLDAAASGVNRVERDGVSVEHPADFTLVGTMNPEEGDLRPQLRDRFGLQATVTGSQSVDERVTIIDRVLDENQAPDAFADAYRDETAALESRLGETVERLPAVDLPTGYKTEIAELCLDAGVEGHRADIAIARTARTLAALDGRMKVIDGDVREAAELALPHRMQRRPFDDAADADELLDDHFDEPDEPDEPEDDGNDGETGDDAEAGNADDSNEGNEDTAESNTTDSNAENAENGDNDGSDNGGASTEGTSEDADSDPAEIDSTGDGNDSTEMSGSDSDNGNGDNDSEETEATPLMPGQKRAAVGEADKPPVDGTELTAETASDGNRATVSESRRDRGPRVRTERATGTDDIDVTASVRTAASNGRTQVDKSDLRTSINRGSARTLIVFVVDASASMRSAMAETKGTVLSLLEDAYQQRDEVAFVAVSGETADVLLPPTTSVELAARHLKKLPTGDRTPLPAGLDAAHRLVSQATAESTLVVVVTDGRATVADGSPTQETRSAARQLATTDASVIVVDAGDDGTGVTGILVSETDSQRIPLAELSAERVADAADSE